MPPKKKKTFAPPPKEKEETKTQEKKDEEAVDVGPFVSRDVLVADWFDAVVGVTEPVFSRMSSDERAHFFSCRRPDSDDGGGEHVVLRRGGVDHDGGDVQCGVFEVISLQQLRTEITSKKKPSSSQKKTKTPFVLLTRNDDDIESIRCVDVSHLQSQACHVGCLFQVASNMNAVEAIAQQADIESDTFVTDYCYDRTQGPAASISCGAAAVARLYCCPKKYYTTKEEEKKEEKEDKKNSPLEQHDEMMDGKKRLRHHDHDDKKKMVSSRYYGRQTRGEQVNFLSGWSEWVDVENGYAVVKKAPKEEKEAGKKKEELEQCFVEEGERKEKTLGLVQVGLHRNCQVTHGARYVVPDEEDSDSREYEEPIDAPKKNAKKKSNKKDEKKSVSEKFSGVVDSPSQLIHQVFVAAINMGQGRSGVQNKKHKWGEPLSVACLEAMYEATYACGVRCGARRLFLTLLGCGAFRNTVQQSLRAACRAHRKYGHLYDTVELILYAETRMSPELSFCVTEALRGEPWEFHVVKKGVREMIYAHNDETKKEPNKKKRK